MEDNKKINWFPSHMRNALDDIESTKIKLVDAVLYVLDSRAPLSCISPKIEKITHGKPVVYVFNKIDLADEQKVKEIQKQFESEGKRTLLVSSKEQKFTKKIIDELKLMLDEKIKRNSQKGINLTYKILVLGVPNTGKSTIINLLCGSKKVMTGNKAGVTRLNSGWLKAGDNFLILDTPGVLWPKFDEEISYNLAFIGCLNDANFDMTDMGFKLMETIYQKYPSLIKNAYQVDFNKEEFLEIYDQICLKRGFKMRGNEIDYERAGKAFVDEFRAGKFGKITLD